MDESPEFQFGQRVEIAGRTMLRPGFSLVGLTGVVFPTLPNAPAGCVTVAIDWPEHGYTPANGYPDGTLPAFVNVPAIHLTALDSPGATALFSLAALFANDTEEDEDEPEAPAANTAPALQILGGGTPRLVPVEPVTEAESDDEPEPEPPSDRPRLRMI